jgi:hypothetical protein
MLKTSALILLLTASAYSQAQTSAPTEEKKDDSGPTLPLIKKVENKEESRIHLGLNMGINNPEGSRGATPELGIDIGFQPVIPFGVSLELSTSKFDGADREMYHRTTLMTRGTYNFGGDTPVIKYSYVGIATGPVFLHDGMELGVAPLTGFDVPITDDHACSLGFMARYLFVTSKDPDSLITSVAIKHWF